MDAAGKVQGGSHGSGRRLDEEAVGPRCLGDRRAAFLGPRVKHLDARADASPMRTASSLRKYARVALAAGLVCGLLAGCGSAHSAGKSQSRVVPVTEQDFHIEAPSTLTAGTYTFRVHNEGVTDHEFIIAPATNGRLPLRRDGLTVAEEVVESAEPGLLEPGSPGAVRTLTVQLKPGRYIFFCNMEGHYMAGMHHEVVVN
jgi:hypothetical protein